MPLPRQAYGIDFYGHEKGEILSEEHLAEGTAIHAYVDGGLAKAIEIATAKQE